MKVTCISCHKKFDNDKYYGICPKCGAFNKLHFGVDDDHEHFHQMYDDDKNAHSEYAGHEHYHEKYDDDKNAHSEYAGHEHFHQMYDDTASHAKLSTEGMNGISVYSEELNKTKKAYSQNPDNTNGTQDKSIGTKFVKWFIIIIIIANILPGLIEWFYAFISNF